jgi:transposase
MAFCSKKDHDGGVKSATKAKAEKVKRAVPRDRKFTIEDLWTELQQVRSALEVSELRAGRLESRVRELEQENQRLRKKRWETEEYLQRQIRKLEKDVAQRDEKLEAANKQLAWFRKHVFDKKSEKDGLPEEQDKETEDQPEQQEKERRNRGQQPGSKGHGRTDRSGVPVVDTVTLGIPGGCACLKCGKPYRLLSKMEDSPMTEIALELFQILYQLEKYVSQCKCEGKKIVTAPPPPKLYPKTTIGNTLWVHLTVQKFLQGVPTNRTLKELSLYGFSLAEGTVTGGMQVINDLLEPLYQALIDHCRGADLWNADETTWRMFDASKTRWWLWVIASDDAVVHILDPSRSKKVPSNFFAGSAGVLMTDRLSSYKALHDSIQKAWCWVHVRRDFLKIFEGMPSLSGWAKVWLEDIAKLFILNENRFKLFQKGQCFGSEWNQAQTELAEHLEYFGERWKRQLQLKKLHPEKEKALNSLKRHWGGLTLFLKDPRIPLHNNRAERLLRNAVIVRKNSFGSGAEWAGHLAAKLFSIFQTWLINGLDPQALLLDYFNECSKSPGQPPPDIRQFLPWSMSAERKQELALPKSYKAPG